MMEQVCHKCGEEIRFGDSFHKYSDSTDKGLCEGCYDYLLSKCEPERIHTMEDVFDEE